MLLAEGRAVGDKQLREYMEVRGYADAAKWVYGQAIEPGDWSNGKLLTLTEVRRVHEMAMTAVWDVAPHPDLTPAEAPGSFREHEIQPFPSGHGPPVVGGGRGGDERLARAGQRPHGSNGPIPRGDRRPPLPLRADPSVPRRQRPGRPTAPQPRCWSASATPRRSSTRTSGVPTSRPCAAPIRESRERWVSSSREQFSTTSIGSSFRLWPDLARLVPIAALANRSITASALRTAAVRGRLQATKGADGQWRSTRNWVNRYLSTRAPSRHTSSSSSRNRKARP